MRPLTGRVPVRIDLAGGTIDIWPIHLTLPEPGVTVNAAVDVPARVDVAPLPGDEVALVSEDRRTSVRFETMDDLRASLAADGPLPLLARAVAAVVPEGGVSVTTSAASPQGAGLGGSSALLACVVATLSEAAGRGVGREEVRRLAQDLETAVIRVPTGYQDYYPPLFGGCLALEGLPGGVRVERLSVDLDALSRRLRLVYTGVPHDSGLKNWGAMRAWFDGETATRDALLEIAGLAREVRDALRRGDLDRALGAVVAEGRARRRMAPGITTPRIEALDAAVRAAGATGTKPLGAGGGGCVLVVLPEGPEPAGIAGALRTAGGEPIACRLTAEGITYTEQSR